MSLQELNNNKLRSALSLTGVAFGIFCIISVLALVNSLQTKVEDDVKQFGTNTVYIDKWDYNNNADYPWWKYINRPTPKYDEVSFIKEKSTLAKYVSYFNSSNTNVKFEDQQINNAAIYGVSEDFNGIQTINIAYGRYLNANEFQRGNAVGVIGYELATQLFGKAERAVDKSVMFEGKKINIAGVIEKQGKTLLQGFDYDDCVILTYKTFASMYDVNGQNTQPFIMVNGKENVPTTALIDELKGVMRQLRRLKPLQEDNFALNDVGAIGSSTISGFFGTVNTGGWAIAGLSLIVGAFGVANIMFVTVRERTSQIGLKKALGAKKRTILTEFLLESAFLCVIGGIMGILFVWLLTLILNSVLPFTMHIAPGIILTAFTICIVLGIVSGIIPASIAARMNPVDAIRSK